MAVGKFAPSFLLVSLKNVVLCLFRHHYTVKKVFRSLCNRSSVFSVGQIIDEIVVYAAFFTLSLLYFLQIISIKSLSFFFVFRQPTGIIIIVLFNCVFTKRFSFPFHARCSRFIYNILRMSRNIIFSASLMVLAHFITAFLVKFQSKETVIKFSATFKTYSIELPR